MSWWATSFQLRGKDIDLTQFDNDTMRIFVDTSKLVYQRSMRKYYTGKPAKFTVENWIQWNIFLYDYFDEKSNGRGIQLK